MRILFSIHLFPPKHRCGAEIFCYHIIKFLQSKGHECRVLLHQANMFGVKVPYTYDDIPVYGNIGTMDQYLWADVLVTHLDYTHKTLMIGAITKRPVICIAHNTQTYNCITTAHDAWVVYNCQHTKDVLNYKWPSVVLPPPCDYRKYDVGKNPIDNEYITLISLSHNKGGEILYRLAAAMPDRKFLGVMGSYDPQMVRQVPNVTILPKQQDMSVVYSQTRILIMPSLYESWGMTGTEAMSNGIPVIACETPGLKENLGYAGLFMPMREWEDPEARDKTEKPYDIDGWIQGIEFLDDRKRYAEFSKLSRERSREHDPINSMEEFNSFLYKARSSGNYKYSKLSVHSSTI